jgi:hypothetical protein
MSPLVLVPVVDLQVDLTVPAVNLLSGIIEGHTHDHVDIGYCSRAVALHCIRGWLRPYLVNAVVLHFVPSSWALRVAIYDVRCLK